MPTGRHSIASSSSSSSSSTPSSSLFVAADKRSADKWHRLTRTQKRAFKIARETSPLDPEVDAVTLKHVFQFARHDRTDEYPTFVYDTMRFWIAYAVENGNTLPIITFLQSLPNCTHSLQTILNGHAIRAFALVAFFIQLHSVDPALSDLMYNCGLMEALDLEDQTIPSMLVDHFALCLKDINALDSGCSHPVGQLLGLSTRARKTKRRLPDRDIICDQAYGLDLVHEYDVRIWNPPGYRNGKASLRRAKLEIRTGLEDASPVQIIDLSDIRAIRRIQLSVYIKTSRHVVQLYFQSTDEVLAFQYQLVAWCSSTDEFSRKIEKAGEDLAELEGQPSPFPTQSIEIDTTLACISGVEDYAAPPLPAVRFGSLTLLMRALLPSSPSILLGLPSSRLSARTNIRLQHTHLT